MSATDTTEVAPGSLGWLYEPELPSHWHQTTLYPLATWINGMAFKNIHFSATGRPVIKIAEVKNGVTSQTKFTDAEYADRYHIDSGDLIFSWSGQPETSIGAFVWEGPEGWLNQHLFKVIPDESQCDSGFFRYLLDYLKPNFIGIARNKQTTGLGHVTKTDLENLVVRVPDLHEQRRIAGVLGRIDQRISLNIKSVGDLDAIMRQAFIETQQGKIERRCLLGDIATFRKGVSYRTSELGPSDRALVTLKSFGRDGTYRLEGLKPWNGECKLDQVMEPGEFAVAQTDLTQAAEVVGRVVRVPPASSHSQLVASLDLMIVRPQPSVEEEYLFGTLLDPRFREHCRSMTHGTTVLHLASDALPSYEVDLAIESSRKRFSKLATSILKRRDAFESQRERLSQLRGAMVHELFDVERRS